VSDYARKLVGIEALAAGCGGGAGRADGAGEVIGIVDSGLDRDHPDFADRVRYLEPGVAGGLAKDHDGHGTHVTGIAAGSGAASGGRVQGMAPAAELVVVGIVSEDGRLMLPPDLGDLLRQTADQGARIINLSWETPLASTYDQGARAVDAFVRERPEVLVVIAAGNEGTLNAAGYPRIRSLGTPATAKNALTVGACTSLRPGISDTWGTYKPELFATPPASEGPVAGDPTFVAPLSSRGPTDFESIKPDLVAPGTAILAPRAAGARAGRMWRDWPEHCGRYGLMTGTSMAAPVVSGAAAVARQVLKAEGHPDPTAAALKAVLLAGAQPLPWRRPQEDAARYGYPDFDQGFGRLDLAAVLPGPHAPAGRRTWLADVRNDCDGALEARAPSTEPRHKAACQYRFTVADGEPRPLRLVMTWSDYQEAAVQNCLSLELKGPGGMRVRGNDRHLWKRDDVDDVDPKALQRSIDRRNNVQVINLDQASPGAYTLTVFASNTLMAPQGYGLCVTGFLSVDPVTACGTG